MSFRKFKKGSKQAAPGTRISIINGQTLTSTGVASLDELLGGGIPLGRLLLIKSDRYTGYAHLLLKYFIAQGIAHEHTVSLSSLDTAPEDTFSSLMGIVKGKQESVVEDESNDKEEDFIPQLSGMAGLRPMGALRDTTSSRSSGRGSGQAAPMTIAWRYQRLPQFSTALNNDFKGPNNSTYCHIFDLTKKIETDMLNSASLYLNGADSFPQVTAAEKFGALLEKLENEIKAHKEACSSESAPRKVLRIALHNMGSPYWGSDSLPELFVFIHNLKTLLENNDVVVAMTIPAYLYNDFHNSSVNPFVRRIEYAADCVLEVESFSGTPNYVDEKYTSDYHGLIHAHSLFSNEAGAPSTRLSTVELNSLGFKVRRKRFLIEQFTLPPEEDNDEPSSESQKRSSVSLPSSSPGCASSSSSKSNPLDF